MGTDNAGMCGEASRRDGSSNMCVGIDVIRPASKLKDGHVRFVNERPFASLRDDQMRLDLKRRGDSIPSSRKDEIACLFSDGHYGRVDHRGRQPGQDRCVHDPKA